jgi:hypothetical protein
MHFRSVHRPTEHDLRRLQPSAAGAVLGPAVWRVVRHGN